MWQPEARSLETAPAPPSPHPEWEISSEREPPEGPVAHKPANAAHTAFAAAGVILQPERFTLSRRGIAANDAATAAPSSAKIPALSAKLSLFTFTIVLIDAIDSGLIRLRPKSAETIDADSGGKNFSTLKSPSWSLDRCSSVTVNAASNAAHLAAGTSPITVAALEDGPAASALVSFPSTLSASLGITDGSVNPELEAAIPQRAGPGARAANGTKWNSIFCLAAVLFIARSQDSIVNANMASKPQSVNGMFHN